MAISCLAWSYVIDWLTIIAAIVIALILLTVHPDDHKFCVLDLSISYPYREAAKVSLLLFIFLTIIAPIVIIAGISLFASPAVYELARGSLVRPSTTWQRKLWELHAGLLGLGVSLATATVIFTGVKNLTGKPRPDFLERCQPDLDRIEEYKVGGFGQRVSPLWVMVTMEICRQPDKSWLNDGLRSFPSGYATISFASLWYLSLWLCAKLNITVPSAANCDHSSSTCQQTNEENEAEGEELLHGEERAAASRQPASHRLNRAPAAPPAFLLPLPYLTFGLAVFIAGTRYFDFRNHGFDVLAAAAIGSLTAWLGFRWYHPPLSSGARAAWGPRGDDKAFRSIAL